MVIFKYILCNIENQLFHGFCSGDAWAARPGAQGAGASAVGAGVRDLLCVWV